MITIFAVPKKFQGHFKVIQTNAIRSWALLSPKPEIILLGDDAGTAQIASELGLRHIESIRRNKYGTPLMCSVFELGQKAASNNWVCYVNSDIILMSDFMEMVDKVSRQFKGDFLAIGRKSNLEINRLIDYSFAGWETELRKMVKKEGKYVTYDSDFFLFPTGMFKGIPPFALGRCFWTQWLIYKARANHIPVINTTASVMSVESKHDYSHAKSTGFAKRLSGPEYVLNRKLFKGCKYFTTADCTQLLTSRGIVTAPWGNRFLSLRIRAEYCAYFLLKGNLYPYSLPLIILYRWGLASFRMAIGRK